MAKENYKALTDNIDLDKLNLLDDKIKNKSLDMVQLIKQLQIIVLHQIL